MENCAAISQMKFIDITHCHVSDSCIFFNTLCFSFITYCFQCVLVSLLVLMNELLLLRPLIAQHMNYVIKFTFTTTMMLIFAGSRPDTR